MRYSYKLPSVEIVVGSVFPPQMVEPIKDVKISLGESTVEVEGSAVELIDFTRATMKEIKSFCDWIPSFMQKCQNGFIDEPSDIEE